MTAVANTAFTAAQFNTHVRDNLNETAPAKATTAGSLMVVTGANSIAERIPEEDFVNAAETTTSTSYTDLTSPGPSVTVTTSTNAIIMLCGRLSNNAGGSSCRMAVDISGASTVAANDNRALDYESSNADDAIQSSYAFTEIGLTPGSNVFTAKYKVNSGTGTFDNRRLTVVPL